MNARESVSHLKGVKKSGAGWTARCPAHDDKNNSLSVSDGDDGKLLLHCHAGCSFESILAAIPDSNNGSRREITATYDYCDQDGKLAYQSVRYEPKGFSLRRPDGNDGWEWKLNGSKRFLYRLPELLKAKREQTILIGEGEKDVDRLAEMGLVATCNPCGAGKWRDDYNESLRGRKVAILPDNDEPGRSHAAQVAASLHGIAASVKVIELPGLPDKGDVSDWLDNGGNLSKLRTLVNDAPLFEKPDLPGDTTDPAKPILSGYREFMAQPEHDGEVVAFEAYRGELVLFQSITNHGKSTVFRNAALCMATGRPFLPLYEGGRPLRVALLNYEGAAARLRQDLRLMERVFDDAELKLIAENFSPTHAPELDDEPLTFSNPQHVRIITSELQGFRPDVVMIDTMSAGFSIHSENDNAEIVAVMKTGIRLARALQCVGIYSHHIGKSKAEGGEAKEAAHRGRGASSAPDFAAAVFNIELDQATNLVTLTCAKRKTGTGQNYEAVLRLDRDARWLSPTSEAAPRPLTNREQVLRVLSAVSLPTAGVEQKLHGKMSERTVRACLKQLVDDGLATQPKRGFWALRDRQNGLGKSPEFESQPEGPLPNLKGSTDNDLQALGKLGKPLYALPNVRKGDFQPQESRFVPPDSWDDERRAEWDSAGRKMGLV